MKINLLNTQQDISILQRLLKARNVACTTEDFLNPTLKKYRIPTSKLNDIDKATSIIFSHIKENKKIMVFGDYDVDGVTSSFSLYSFFTKHLHHKNISIMYPNRLKDGYGLKCKHIDMMKEKNIDLIITVDNGITSIQEAAYAKELWIKLVITDHHHALDIVPDADAIINPQVSQDYEFKGIAGVGVAFKLINALMKKANFSSAQKKEVFQYFLPIVAIGTVADCVPLVNENRAMVKKWLEIINRQREKIPESLKGFLKHVNIKDQMDTFHIGFVIGPRINAGGRLASPYDSLRTLLFSWEKQKEYLEKIDEINTERKKLQDKAHRHALKLINTDEKILIATDHSYHEGIVGIVAWRITEKFYKPSVVLHMCKERGIAVGSLRWPDYFNVVEMLKTADHLLERYGGHKQAGGLTVKLENLDSLKNHFLEYVDDLISEETLIRTINVDTIFYAHEWNNDTLRQIQKLAPFGVGNEEPNFLFEECTIVWVDKVGQRGKGHLKLSVQHHDNIMTLLRRSKGDLLGEYNIGDTINIIGKIKPDNYHGGFFIDCSQIITPS